MPFKVCLLLLIILALSGCSAGSGYPPPQDVTVPESVKVMQGLKITVERIMEEEQKSHDLEELQQMKISTEQYRRSQSPDPGYTEAQIDLLTEDDVAAALDRLAAEGHISSANAGQDEVAAALRIYQGRRQLPVSGRFDSATIRCLQRED